MKKDDNVPNRLEVYDKINMKMKSKEHLYSPLCFDNQRQFTYRNNILNRLRTNPSSKIESVNRLKAIPSDSFNLIEKKLSSNNKNFKKSKQAAKKLNENKKKMNDISLKMAKINDTPNDRITFQSKDEEYAYAISQKSIKYDSNSKNNHMNSQTIKSDNDENEYDENRTEFNYDDDSDDIYDDDEEDENDTDHSTSNYEEDDDYNYEEDEDEYEDPNSNENYNLHEPTSTSCAKTCDNYDDEYDYDYEYEEKSLAITTNDNNKSKSNDNNSKELENEYDDVDVQNESQKISKLSIEKEKINSDQSENSHQSKNLETDKVFSKEKEQLFLPMTTKTANTSLPIDTDILISCSTDVNSAITMKQKILSITNVTAVDENELNKCLELDNTRTNNLQFDELIQIETNKNDVTTTLEKTYINMNECNEQTKINSTSKIDDEYETMTVTTVKEKIETGLDNSITCTSF
jgi:hypothetical protein